MVRRMVRKRVVRKRRAGRKPMRRVRKAGAKAVNTASIRENFQVSVPDGGVVFQRTLQLANATFDRARQVAQAYQEFCIKSVVLHFRPSADTFPIAAGNSMPQLYYIQDKAGAVPIGANLQTLLDMGVRPIRFDDRNIRKSFKPVALIGADTDALGTLSAGLMSKVSPWLATNASAGVPSGVWTPSTIEHGGCVFFVSKINGATPPVNYTVDIEVIFNFRKPLWRIGTGDSSTNLIMSGDQLITVS